MLSRHTEIELKLTCTDDNVWEKIMTAQSLLEIAIPESRACKLLDARYFDTSTYCLQKAKLAYRIRRESEQWIATIKGGGTSSGGLHERQEWNVVVSSAEPDLTVFSDTDIGKRLLEIVGSQLLEPIVITQFERRSLDVMMPDGSLIEIAADQGIIMAGSKSTPILEVELELKSGNPSALFKLGAVLAKEYPLLPESDSKFYRGLILLGLGKSQSQKAVKVVPIDKNQSATEGLRAIIAQLITQFLAVQQVFLKSQAQPEHVHELRICLRRLRSLLHLAGPIVVSEQYGWYQEELKKLGKALGVVREIDVAYDSWKQLSDCQSISIESSMNLGELLSKRRLLESEKIVKILHAGAATPLLLDLWATITDNSKVQLTQQPITVGEYAVSKLSHWLKTAIKQGKTINWTDTENVHKLRLQVKRIKYVAEALEPVLYEVSQLILRLDVLQDNLGLVNDTYSTEVLLKKLLKVNSSKALYLEAGMVIGWQRREVLFGQSKMNKHWKNFYRTAQRWM
ncbi:MAG: CYTH and CHAD domain-containing protein [Sporomusaceae bacterium]|nr:CYTH and CHAD domain-containing protein [Sporomusaceae bacterium]